MNFVNWHKIPLFAGSSQKKIRAYVKVIGDFYNIYRGRLTPVRFPITYHRKTYAQLFGKFCLTYATLRTKF